MFYRSITSRGSGGGVAIINQKSVHHIFVSTPVFPHSNALGSVITSSNNSFKLFVMYRHHPCPHFSEFESV